MILLHGFFEAFDQKNEACGCLYSFGFFLSCLQMTNSPLYDPEGCTTQQQSESAKTVMFCFKRAECAYSETPQLQKAKCLHC